MTNAGAEAHGKTANLGKAKRNGNTKVTLKKIANHIVNAHISNFLCETTGLFCDCSKKSDKNRTRLDTRHKMRVLFTFENNTGHTQRRMRLWPYWGGPDQYGPGGI